MKIVADSRGRLLKPELHRLSDDTVYFNTRFRKGAKLIDLWEIVEEELQKGQTDLLVIYGGICDITDVSFDHRGRRNFWPPDDIRGRFTYIKALLSGLADNYNLLNSSTKVCFIPEPGTSLAMINNIPKPVDDETHTIQMRLEEELTELRCHMKHVNDRMNIITPWTLKVSHVRRNNRWYPVYRRSADGLHPTRNQAYKMALILKEFSERILVNKREERF